MVLLISKFQMAMNSMIESALFIEELRHRSVDRSLHQGYIRCRTQASPEDQVGAGWMIQIPQLSLPS
jgi:hypothetical protein